MGGRRAKPEEKASALVLYEEGVFITEISARTGFGTTTIYRWACEAGIVKSFSERLATGAGSRQFGREVIGRKGVFHTSKGGAWIHTDSTYEYARLEQLEDVDDVVFIDRCDHRIPYIFGGKPKTYIPDFKLRMRNGLTIVEEVKPARWVSDPKVRAKVSAAEKYFRDAGIVFRVITEADIGADRLKQAALASDQKRDPEAIAAARERRKAQRRAAQRNLIQRFKANATPEQMAAFRAKFAGYARDRRARKKAAANLP